MSERVRLCTNARVLTVVGAVAAGLCVGVIGGLVIRDDFKVTMMSFFLLLCVGVLLVFLSILAWIVARVWKTNAMLWAATGMVACVAFIVTQAVVSWPVAYACEKHDVADARSYCEKLVPGIEAHKQATDTYPESLDGIVPPGRPLPRLLRARNLLFYPTAADGSYMLQFHAPGRFFSEMHTYDSKTGKWMVSD